MGQGQNQLCFNVKRHGVRRHFYRTPGPMHDASVGVLFLRGMDLVCSFMERQERCTIPSLYLLGQAQDHRFESSNAGFPCFSIPRQERCNTSSLYPLFFISFPGCSYRTQYVSFLARGRTVHMSFSPSTSRSAH